MKPSALRARYWRIVAFFARVTAGFIFWEIVLPRLGMRGLSRRTRAERMRRTAVRFRALAIRMTGLMIKVGQFLSARLDVLPPEITDELSGLQDEVPAEEFSAIRTQAETELGSLLSERFEWFDAEPLAAASLGQVHRARLCAEDAEQAGFENVVVKVQRPYIEQIVETDLAALRRVARWLSRYRPIARRADVPAIVEEFALTTREEIDYLAEGHNAEQFAENFAHTPHVHVPEVVWALTTRRVLTLEDVAAIKISDYDAITGAGIERREVAAVLVDTYMHQILENGFFHADPHPGNLFVTPAGASDAVGQESDTTGGVTGGVTPPEAASADPSGDASPDWRLTFIDFGMVGRVPDNLREGLREALIAIGTQDGKRLVQSYKTLGVLLPSADIDLIERASMQAFERFGGMSMADLRAIDHREMAGFALQFRELMLDLPFQLPENLLLLGRCIGILNGMATGLDPEFNAWETIAPYANRLIAEEGGNWWDTLIAEGGKLLQTAIALPGRADRVLTQMERGELSVQTPLLDLRVRGVQRALGRVVYALVFAALLLAGAILRTTDPALSTWLMLGSVVPGLAALVGGRGRHPGL